MTMTKIASGMLEYIAASSALNNRLLAEVNDHRAHRKVAADKRTVVCDTLISLGAVPATEKSAALKLLANHGTSLDLLVNAAQKMARYKQASEKAAMAKSAGDLGQPVDAREAGFGPSRNASASLTSPFVGRRTSEKKASDMALLAVLGPPQGR